MIKDLWKVRKNIALGWMFIFCLSLLSVSKYNMLITFLICGAYSIVITIFVILFVKSKWYKNNKSE